MRLGRYIRHYDGRHRLGRACLRVGPVMSLHSHSTASFDTREHDGPLGWEPNGFAIVVGLELRPLTRLGATIVIVPGALQVAVEQAEVVLVATRSAEGVLE
jgi:hypothetical protein